MENVVIQLTVNQINVILLALSELPYKSVFELVDSIKTQANYQLNPPETRNESDSENSQ